MMRLNKTLATGFMVIGMGVMSLSSYAQGVPSDGMRAKPALSAEKIAKFEKEKARRDAALHDKLKITAAQEGAWKAFLDTKQVGQQPREHRLSMDERAKLTTPERLDRQLAWMKQAETHLIDRIAATKALYTVLTTEQQQVFDAESARAHKERFKKFRAGGDHQTGKSKE